MSSKQNWVEALNINPESLTEWSAKAPAGKPLLVYCLEQGLIPLREYFAWASEHFGLPVLDAAYFHKAFDPEFLDKARATGAWNPWCYPVDQWEDVTIVACVEPPQEHDEKTVRYVLTDPNALREFWGGTGTSIRPSANKTVEPPALKLKVPPIPPPPVPKAAAEPPMSDEKTPVEEPSLAEELPNGLKLQPKPYILHLDETTVNFNINNAPAKPSVPPPAMPPEEPVAKEEVESEASIHIGAKTTVTPPAPAPELKLVEVKAEPEAKPPAAPAKPQATPAASGKPVSEEQATQELFASLAERYQGVAVMKVSNQSAHLYKHDSKITPSSETAATLNLSYPTFLRIVSKTSQPYHGYLVDSPAHREFFEGLGFHELPKCVTALPIRVNEKIWGMVIAMGEEENQKMESLAFMQEHCEKYVSAMTPAWSKAA